MFDRKPKNVVLIEMTVVALFFALSAAIIVQVFALAHRKGEDSAQLTGALLIAQDWAEQFTAAPDPQQMLLAGGWEATAGQYVLGSGDYVILVRAEREARPAGAMVRMVICVYKRDEAERAPLVTLPIDLYRPRWEGAA